jgi:hypothetical protein
LANTFRRPIIALATRYRLPAIHGPRDFVVHGGLISYCDDVAGNYRSAAVYVDRILRGEKPGDPPVQQSVKIELWREDAGMAAGLVDRIAEPVMVRARHDAATGEEAGLFERALERLRSGNESTQARPPRTKSRTPAASMLPESITDLSTQAYW